ncbi:MAG TPA: hypothetical protein VMA32_14000 [Streptosporangiaceae bacterium]|nr:hypothetical protein [Streptosporangiaceae bacterium]
MSNPGPISVALALIIGIVGLVLGGIQVASAISASQGHGTAGYFVAQRLVYGRSGIYWYGEFELRDGTVVRSGTEFYGSDASMTAGSVVPAVDTGDPFGVYQPHGTDSWSRGASFLFLGVIGLAAAAHLARRLRSGGSAGSDVDGAGQLEPWAG